VPPPPSPTDPAPDPAAEKAAAEAAAKADAEAAAKADEEAAAKAAAEARQAALDADDPEAGPKLREMKKQRALADVSKPIEPAAEAIWSQDPDKGSARKAIQDAYAKVARVHPDDNYLGDLRIRYNRLDDKFRNAAADMLRSRSETLPRPVDPGAQEESSHLVLWIKRNLTGDGPVRKVLLQRKQLGTRLASRVGPRESALQAAVDKTKSWEKAFARWSAPDKEINALMSSYADRIDQLNADINTDNNRDQAIFSFWFEVAPVHLQLRDATVDDSNAPGVTRIRAALADFPDLQGNYLSGADRTDGSLYLIDPAGLQGKREAVLNGWKDAAEAQATADADYSTRPDAAADLKPRYDKLRDDGWIKGTRDGLATPKP
jgi:hypothetical protein